MRRMLMGVWVMVAAGGCYQSREGGVAADALVAGPPLSAVTYNVGLAPLDVPLTSERAPYVIDAVADLDADVLCVQELWMTEHFEALRAATDGRYSTVLRRDPMPGTASCSLAELGPLATCAATSCPTATGDALAGCALSRCGAQVGSLSSGCLDCVLGAVSAGADVAGVAERCVGDGGAGYIYGGAFDVALFVAPPVVDTGSLVLDSYAVRASVEYARVEAPGGDIHLFCTHLASNISRFDYRGDHGDWRGEQARQIDQLLAFVDEKAGTGGRVVLMGDLNTGPEILRSGISGQWTDHYARLVHAGFVAPYARQRDVACTSCADNTLRSGGADKLIDHLLVRGIPAAAALRGERLFTVPALVGGELTHMSDHYGLRLSTP